MSEGSFVDQEKNPKRALLEILKILTSFYSFRELEKRLGFPMQMLWKYHTLRTTPEKETALKILKRIQETRIIDEIIKRVTQDAEDVFAIIGNIGILELAAFDASELIRRHKITTLISMPDSYSAALASLIASNTRINMCITDQTYASSNSICTVIKTRRNMPVLLCPQKSCIARNGRAMLIESMYIDGSINQVHKFISRYGSELQVVYIVCGNVSEVQADLQKISGERPKIKILIETK